MPDLNEYRDAVEHALRSSGLSWETWPEVAATAPLDDHVRLSALLLLLTTRVRSLEPAGKDGLTHHEAAAVIDRLRRRRLPWDSSTACLALDLVTRDDFDEQRVAVALRGAEQVCASGEADAALLDALQRCADWLDTLPVHVWRVPEIRLLVRRVMAASTPPDFLDLSLLRDGDAWVVPARSAARALPAEDVAPLVRHLGRLGPRQPSQAWLRDVERSLLWKGARALLRAWLERAADTDVVPPDDVAAFSGGMLFAHGNEDVVRAAVLATRVAGEESWVPETLGVLARRGAATSGVPGMTASLSLKVASAAVDTLAARATPADRSVLEELLEDLSRRDLVRRVGAALGRETEAARRDEQLRREKAAAVRRKADPAPRRARAAVDVLIRRHLGPELRRHGFKGSGRTWRRAHSDRVDVIGIGSGDGRVHLSYGTRFDAAHPADEPSPVAREKVRDHHLDIGLSEDWEASDAGLERCSRYVGATLVPFLDTLGRYELARAYLEHDVGAPPGATRTALATSPDVSGVIGMLALAAGDRATAVEHLARRLHHAESWPDEPDELDAAEIRFWRSRLDRARLLR